MDGSTLVVGDVVAVSGRGFLRIERFTKTQIVCRVPSGDEWRLRRSDLREIEWPHRCRISRLATDEEAAQFAKGEERARLRRESLEKVDQLNDCAEICILHPGIRVNE